MAQVGIDLVEIARFEKLLEKNDTLFFDKVFTAYERDYCAQFYDKAPHFAGIFSAKEAVSKALGVHEYPVTGLEIRHTKEGAPVAYYLGRIVDVSVSITHTSTTAGAIAVK
jgi:holo-[acyl-carrier protein] synthase